jgi:hypothetical protein
MRGGGKKIDWPMRRFMGQKAVGRLRDASLELIERGMDGGRKEGGEGISDWMRKKPIELWTGGKRRIEKG